MPRTTQRPARSCPEHKRRAVVDIDAWIRDGDARPPSPGRNSAHGSDASSSSSSRGSDGGSDHRGSVRGDDRHDVLAAVAGPDGQAARGRKRAAAGDAAGGTRRRVKRTVPGRPSAFLARRRAPRIPDWFPPLGTEDGDDTNDSDGDGDRDDDRDADGGRTFRMGDVHYRVWAAEDPCAAASVPDLVGVDVGRRHLALCGVRGDPARDEQPRARWFAVLDAGPGTHVDAACDLFDELLGAAPAFAWFRAARALRIEQQMAVNPEARIVARDVRCCAAVLRRAAPTGPAAAGAPPPRYDVDYVHGNRKYAVLCALVDDAQDPDRRMRGPPVGTLRGAANTRARKLLAERHTAWLLWRARDRWALRWFAGPAACELEKRDDPADAYLIAHSEHSARRAALQREAARAERAARAKRRRTDRTAPRAKRVRVS